MKARSAELSAFLKTLHSGILGSAQAGSDALRVTEKIMQALQTEQPPASPEPAWLTTCELLDDAIENVSTGGSDVGPEQRLAPNSNSHIVEHALAMRKLSSQLAWWNRPDAALIGEPFASGHANATVIGKGGLEERDDVWVGISLLAPGVKYPVHQHPPEEVYLVLSQGHWQKNGGDWFEPGTGGLVHNPPGILHAMRSGSTPLLATWCLWNAQ